MLQLILAHKALVLDLSLPSQEEGEWVLEQLPRQGLFFNTWFEPPLWEALPEGVAGSELWMLD